MQNFITLAAFFLVEKQWPLKKKREEEEEEKIMPSTMVTTSSAQRRSDQNKTHIILTVYSGCSNSNMMVIKSVTVIG